MAKNRIRKPASPNRTPGLTAIAEARIHMLENCKRKKLLNKLDMRGIYGKRISYLPFRRRQSASPN